MARAEIVFICHESDNRWREGLLTQMQPLLKERGLSVWHAGLIRPSVEISAERAAAYEVARVAVVLVSPKLLAEPGDGGIADARMLRERGVPLLWLQVTPTSSQPFDGIQPLYDKKRPLSGLSPHEAEDALAQAAIAICNVARQAPSPDRDYEVRYLQAVANACDQMTLYAAYGLSSETRRHPLSTAYVALDLRADTDADGDGVAGGHTLSMAQVLATLSPRPHAGAVPGRRHPTARRNNLLLIVGEAGRGKTTLLRWIAVQAARSLLAAESVMLPTEERPWDQRVPFFRAVRLDQPGQPVRDVAHLAADIATTLSCRPPVGWEHRVLDAGRGIVLLDGIDEVPPGPVREALLEGIRQLVANNPQTAFVLSSRPAGIADARGMLRALGFCEAHVQPLAGERLRLFADHWHRAVAAQAEQGLAGDERERRLAQITAAGAALPAKLAAAPHIRAIAATPLVAALVCAFHLDRGYLPDNRNELMRTLVDGLIHRHDAYREGMPSWPAYERVSEDNKRLLLGLLAADMVKQREPLVPYDEHGPAGTEALDQHLRPLIERSHKLDDGDLPQLRQGLIQRTGILREPQHGALDFIHLEFRDYLAAQTLIQKAHQETDFNVIARSLKDPDRHGLFYFAVTAPLAIQPEGVADRLAALLLEELAAVERPPDEDPIEAEEAEWLAEMAVVERPPDEDPIETETAEMAAAERPLDDDPIETETVEVTAVEWLTDDEPTEAEQRLTLRQALRRLAVRLSQSDAPVTRALRQRFIALREGLLPPATLEDAEIVAELGDDVVERLGFNAERPLATRLSSIRALRLIDTAAARAELESFAAAETAIAAVAELAEALSPWSIRSVLARLADDGLVQEIGGRLWSRLLASAAALEPAARSDEAVKARQKVDQLFLADDEAARCLLQALAAGIQFPALATLSVMTDAAITAIAASSFFPTLSSLDLSNSKVTDAGIAALAASSFPALRDLKLSTTRVTDAGIAALAASSSLPPLSSLDLSATKVTDSAIAFLSTYASFSALSSLDLNYTGVTDAGIAALAASPFLPILSYLNLCHTMVTDAGIAVLAASSLPILSFLNLCATGVTDAGIAALAASSSLSALSSLNLSDTGVTDVGIAALAASSSLSALHALDLSNTGVTDAGIAALAASSTLPALDYVWVTATDTRFARAGAVVKLLEQRQVLAAAGPSCCARSASDPRSPSLA